MPVIPQASRAGEAFAQAPVRFDPIGTLGDIARLKTVQLQQRQAELELNDYQKQQEMLQRRQAALEAAGDDPRKWRAIVAQFDGPEALLKLDSGLADLRKKGLEADEQEQKTFRAQAGLAVQMLRFVRDAPDPVTAFQSAKPSLQALVPPESGLQIPDVSTPEEAEQVIGQLEHLAFTVEESAKRRDDARKFFLDGKTTEGLALLFSLAESPEQWQQVQKLGQVYDVPDEVLTLFGPFSPENLTKAKTLASKVAQSTGGTSDYARFLERYAAGLGKSAAELTAEEELAGRKRFGQADDAARRPLAPVIVMGPQGPMVTTGSDRTSVTPILDPQGKPLGPAPTAAQRDKATGMQTAGAVIDSIDELSKRINTQSGVIARISGAAERAKAQANLSDDVSEYQALVAGFTPLLARGVGHVGVLTEQDVQSVRQMLPQPGDSESVRNRKIARIRTIMGRMPGGAEIAASGQAQTEAGYTGEVRQTADGRLLGMVNGQVVELERVGSGYRVKR